MAKRKTTSNPAVEFINSLHHTGDFWGKPFALRPWQEEIVRQIFDETGKARYRKVFIALPRKQGKTELAAAILLYLMFGTGKKAQRLFSASGDREQAALIYGAAAAMIRQSQALSDIALVYDGYKRIECKPIDGRYQALSSESAQKYGLRPSVIMLDELWVLPNRDLYKALSTSLGATVDPLTVLITTAGWDQTSLCWEEWQYAKQVQVDPSFDPSYLPIIFAAEKSDDWTSPDVWRKVMPALDDYCQYSFIEEQCAQALKIPARENEFKQLYLNIWTEQAERWISERAWAACGLEKYPWEVEELFGLNCYAGFDYGVTGDMACLWLVFPMADGTVRTAGRAWVPKNGKWRDESRNRDRYLEWNRQGFLRFTDKGDSLNTAIDEDQVEKEIVELNDKFPFFLLCADRAYCNRLLTRLFNEHSIPTNGIPQGSVTLNEACVTLEKLVVNEEIHHGDSPILNWNIQNASVKRNSTGLIHPDKTMATERIDGLAALVNALAAYAGDKEQRWSSSVYDTAGSLLL